ncbi:MAG: competence/damage-inducible protein A [Syntrophobacterales bacterium CG23_combo_of_CG06-09_8_20_14_all_48_27]|nr:MAG: competence/damage-inducible protein A [Syntrophobacterales bacterium CG23_combo_of_CG06-09_8_20_14_all_48_27]
MKVGILTTGNELTSGKTQDTNSSFIARELNVQGWQVAAMMSVGDDENVIRGGLSYIMGISDAVIVTGGLGPTADDITTVAIASTFSLKLYTNEDVLRHIQGLFEKHRLKWTPNNAKQAVFPEGAETICNPIGTAWGFSLKRNGIIVAVIPGVPAEVRRMLPEGVIPLFRREFTEEAQYVESRTIKLFGIAEAGVDQALADVDLAGLGVNIGFYPNFPENHVVLIARHASEAEAKKKLKKAEGYVKERLRDYIFAYDRETLESLVASLLTERKLTLAVAESCTGGLITDRLTDIPGSSAFLERGVVTYSNVSKTELLGVPEQVLHEFGAVSEQTAILMAEGVRKIGKTDLGLAVTGIAGPTGGTEEKPVGTVFIALTDGKKTICHRSFYRWDRRRIKMVSSQSALMMLKRYLTGETRDD